MTVLNITYVQLHHEISFPADCAQSTVNTASGHSSAGLRPQIISTFENF